MIRNELETSKESLGSALVPTGENGNTEKGYLGGIRILQYTQSTHVAVTLQERNPDYLQTFCMLSSHSFATLQTSSLNYSAFTLKFVIVPSSFILDSEAEDCPALEVLSFSCLEVQHFP